MGLRNIKGSSGNSGVGSLHLNTASTVSWDNTELDEALISPSGVPRVLDNVVFDAVCAFTVTNSKDTVIKVSSTAG